MDKTEEEYIRGLRDAAELVPRYVLAGRVADKLVAAILALGNKPQSNPRP